MNQLITLEIEMPYGEVPQPIYPTLLLDDVHCVLVDCGYVGSLPQIEEAFYRSGLSLDTVTHLILTHQDHDHVGAAAALLRKYPNIQVLASAEEAPYLSGERKSLRLEQAEQLQEQLPPEQQAFGHAFCGLLRSVEPVRVDQLLADGELLPFCGGCRVVATPGHTPGHNSLYLPELNTIIAGDAIALEDGIPVLANPQFTLDLEQAKASMSLLLSHPAKRIHCYHGGLYEKGSCCMMEEKTHGE